MGLTERKNREKEKRREDIINIAERLFFLKGYDGVSMDDIARGVELSKATLYLYFKDKESLFFSVVLRGTGIFNALVKEKVAACPNGYEKINAVGRAYIEFVKKYPDYLKVHNFFQSGRFDLEKIGTNDIAKEVIELRVEIFGILNNAILAGIEEGSIRPDVNSVEVAVLLTMIGEGIANMRPDLKKALVMFGISRDQFLRDVGSLERHMLMNTRTAG